MAEVIKTALVSNIELWNMIKSYDICSIQQNDIISQVIKMCAQQKYNIVTNDLNESKKHGREILNFGHTVAHILEGYYTIPTVKQFL